ncbi:MAG: hypothetical protein ABUL60_09635 [Myxococcales bacterium]
MTFEHLPFGMSEYDVSPGSAPLFLVGELWAALHGRSLQLRSLKRDDFRISPAGVAYLAPQAKPAPIPSLEPAECAADLAGALRGYSADDAGALLAGYSRLSVELLERSRPGFSKAVLEHLRAPKPWPSLPLAPFGFGALMRGLGVELRVVGSVPTLVVTANRSLPSLWQEGEQAAFLFILALLVAGVDCRALFQRDCEPSRARSASPLYKLLWPNPEPLANPELERLTERGAEIQLAMALALSLRTQRLPEPFVFNDVLFWVRKVLVVDADQATLLGDALSHVARHCASLVAAEGGAPCEAESYLQNAIILLEYTTRGQPSDEGRLIALTRCLYDLPGYPRPLEHCPTSLHFGVWNSLLLTYRALAKNSALYRTQRLTGLLRSTMTRGLHAARRQLRLTYEASTSRDPEQALGGHALLRVTVKNYALLLASLWESAEDEFQATGASGWRPFFGTPQNPGHLALEAHWIGTFFEAAAAVDGFSLDVSRAFMNAGAPFVGEGL